MNYIFFNTNNITVLFTIIFPKIKCLRVYKS